MLSDTIDSEGTMTKRLSKKAQQARTLTLLEFTSWPFVFGALPKPREETWANGQRLRSATYRVRGEVRRFCRSSGKPDMTVGEFIDQLRGRSPARALNSRLPGPCDALFKSLFTRFGIPVPTQKRTLLSDEAQALLKLK